MNTFVFHIFEKQYILIFKIDVADDIFNAAQPELYYNIYTKSNNIFIIEINGIALHQTMTRTFY